MKAAYGDERRVALDERREREAQQREADRLRRQRDDHKAHELESAARRDAERKARLRGQYEGGRGGGRSTAGGGRGSGEDRQRSSVDRFGLWTRKRVWASRVIQHRARSSWNFPTLRQRRRQRWARKVLQRFFKLRHGFNECAPCELGRVWSIFGGAGDGESGTDSSSDTAGSVNGERSSGHPKYSGPFYIFPDDPAYDRGVVREDVELSLIHI